MRENHIILAGYTRRERKAFDRMRLHAFYNALYSGNMKNPKRVKIQEFMPSVYDDTDEGKKPEKSPMDIYRENQQMHELANGKQKATPQFLEQLRKSINTE